MHVYPLPGVLHHQRAGTLPSEGVCLSISPFDQASCYKSEIKDWVIHNLMTISQLKIVWSILHVVSCVHFRQWKCCS